MVLVRLCTHKVLNALGIKEGVLRQGTCLDMERVNKARQKANNGDG